jgi:hypothetical protein
MNAGAPVTHGTQAARVTPPPDPRIVAAAGRLGVFYSSLMKRSPFAGGKELLPCERKTGNCMVGLGPGIAVAGRSVDYAAALVLAYGPNVVGAWDLSGAQTVIEGWILDYQNAPRFERDPSTGLGPARYHPVDTRWFRDDFDVVIGAVDAAGPDVVGSLLDELGAVLETIRLKVTPQWSATIHRALAPVRERLLDTLPSGRHIREDTFEEYRYRGDAARAEFGPPVHKIGDPLLLTLFEHPQGLHVLRSLARGPEGGGEAARGVVLAAEDALNEFRKGLGSDVHWRYPEFRPAVLERIGLSKVPGLAEYLTAIAHTRVKESELERTLEVGGWAVFALGLIFSGGASAAVVAATGVGVAGLGLGVAFLDDRQRALAAQSYAFERGEKRLIEPRFPVRTAIAAAALLLAAVGFYFQVRGLGKAPAGPARPGPRTTPRPGASAPSPNAPPARAAGPPARLADKSTRGTGAKLGATPKPKPAPSKPKPPPPSTEAAPTTEPPPAPPPPPRGQPSAPAPPRSTPGKPAPGKPSMQDRTTPRVPPAQRLTPADAERIARKAVTDLERKLAEHAASYRAAQARIVAVLEELEKVPENAELVRRLEIAVEALENPQSYADLVVALRREVDAVRNAGLGPAAWEVRLGLTTDELRGAARLIGLTEETAGNTVILEKVLPDQQFLDEVVAGGRFIVDHSFTLDDHGILTHELQSWIIGRALARSGAGTVAELRALLAQAASPTGWKEKASIGARVWGEIWDSQDPMVGQSGLHSPEFITRLLKPDFEGIAPFRRTLPPLPDPVP